MPKIEKILAPIDFSEGSTESLAYAEYLGETFDSVIMVLHVIEPMIPPTIGSPLSTPTPYTVQDKKHEDVEQYFGYFMETFSAKGKKRVIKKLVDGRPHQVIVDLAKEGKFDLIIMGTHGKTGLRRALLGSVAEKVVRHATCPVFTVPLTGMSF